MAEPIIHSYSSMADWKLCPRLFRERWINRSTPFVETAATKRGNRLHKEMEAALMRGKPIPQEFHGNHGFVELLRKYDVGAEVAIGITRDGKGCSFFDKERVWMRGKIDARVPLVKKRCDIMVDWKSGNPNYTDYFQAKVYSALISTATIIEQTLFIWGYFSGEMPFERVVGKEAQKEVFAVAKQVEDDVRYDPSPCWKCRFCPVTWCEYNEVENDLCS